MFIAGEEPKRQSLEARPNESRDIRTSFGGNSRTYERGGRRDDRDRDRDTRDYDRGYDSRYPRRERGQSHKHKVYPRHSCLSSRSFHE